jgi:uncharacterized protein with PIN domain
MPTVPRNAPCPCGSGRKHKLCCGTTRDEERAQRRAVEGLFALPSGFPLLRPDSDDFEDWLTAHRAELQTRELIENAIDVVGATERERISRSFARWFPPVWASLVADVRDEVTAETAVLLGAVVAALAEERLPDELVLELLEDDPELADPAETLALCLEATDLWSFVDETAAHGAVAAIPYELDEDEYARRWDTALEREAARLLTRRHRRRLWLLVRRLSRELPIEEFPRTSHAVGLACAAFERDRRVRSRVAGMLLGDTLGPARWQQLRLAA